MLSLPALLALAENTNPQLVRLSSNSLILFLNMYQYCEPLFHWRGAGSELTTEEIDQIKAIFGKAYDEVMTSIVGLIVPVVLTTLPDYMLPCDGSTYNRTDYPELAAVIDPVYLRAGNTFVTPDLRAKFPLGEGDDLAIDETGGATEHELTLEELPAHSHTNTAHSHTTIPHAHSDLGHIHSEIGALDTVVNGGLEAPAASATAIPLSTGIGFANIQSSGVTVNDSTVTIDETGGSAAHSIMPPYIVVRYALIAK